MIKSLFAALVLAIVTIAFLLGQQTADHGEAKIAAIEATKAVSDTAAASAKTAQESCQTTLRDKETEIARLKTELEALKTPQPTAQAITPTNTVTAVTPAAEPEEFQAGKHPDPATCQVGAVYRIHRQDPGKTEETYRVKVVACYTPDKKIQGMKGLKALMKKLKVGGRALATNICNGSAGRYEAGQQMFVCAPDK